MWKIDERDSGSKLKISMEDYLEYALYNRDDNPLYLFESGLEDHPGAKSMMQDYKPIKYFEHDLFSDLLGDSHAPPHRWFLIGPQRSGSNLHQDPLGTSAWNCSVSGRKRWILIPPLPEYEKHFLRGHHLKKEGEREQAIHYFDLIWPRLKRIEGPEGTGKLKYIECV